MDWMEIAKKLAAANKADVTRMLNNVADLEAERLFKHICKGARRTTQRMGAMGAQARLSIAAAVTDFYDTGRTLTPDDVLGYFGRAEAWTVAQTLRELDGLQPPTACARCGDTPGLLPVAVGEKTELMCGPCGHTAIGGRSTVGDMRLVQHILKKSCWKAPEQWPEVFTDLWNAAGLPPPNQEDAPEPKPPPDIAEHVASLREVGSEDPEPCRNFEPKSQKAPKRCVCGHHLSAHVPERRPDERGLYPAMGLDFGIKPENLRALALWGARMIWRGTGHAPEVVFDRKDSLGTKAERELLISRLNSVLPTFQADVRHGRVAIGDYMPRAPRQPTWTNGDVEIYAGTNASGGYLYVTARLSRSAERSPPTQSRARRQS
jgi:hypothetical protein